MNLISESYPKALVLGLVFDLLPGAHKMTVLCSVVVPIQTFSTGILHRRLSSPMVKISTNSMHIMVDSNHSYVLSVNSTTLHFSKLANSSESCNNMASSNLASIITSIHNNRNTA